MKKVYLICNICIVCAVLILGGFAFFVNTSKVFNNSNSKAIYSGKNGVSLMINVYWGDEYLDGMLNILKQNDVKATFFVGGSYALSHNESIKKIFEGGHEIANHGYFHKDHKLLSFENNKTEISRCHDVVKNLTGVDMSLFAPPSGSFNSTTLKAAKECGYSTIMWSKDTIDWRDHNETLIFERATKNVKNGDLILMHPTEHTLNALPKIIDEITKNDLNFTTVSQNIL